MQVSRISRPVTVLLYILLMSSCVFVITLPFLIDTYALLFNGTVFSDGVYRLFVIILLMVSGSGTVWILIELISMMKSTRKDPFITRNVTSLRRMGVIALFISALFFIKCIVYLTPLTLACALVLMLCGLFSLVLMDVFKQAVKYKQENDLTI
ncbi:MAG: DUF2975 domain-containing protein [Christensenellales bacterium]|jgi:hypothetical protein